MQIKFSENFPIFYHEIAKSWSKIIQEPLTTSSVLSQPIWFNKFLTIGGNVLEKRFDNELFVSDFYSGHNLLTWQAFKSKFNLRNAEHFLWIQIVNAIPSKWKKIIEESQITNHPQKFQHLLMVTRELPLEKLTSKYIYTLKLSKIKEPPSSQITIMGKIQENDLNWNLIYTNGRLCSRDSYTRSFYFKCAHNILYLNERLFKFKKAPSQLCSFCKTEKENILHLFFKCSYVTNLWCKLNDKLILQLPPLSPKSAFFGFPDNSKLINHIHLIFRIAVYNSRSSSTCQVQYILNKIINAKKVELNIGKIDQAIRTKFVEKWSDFALQPPS